MKLVTSLDLYKFMIVNSLDEHVWRGFVDQHPKGNIFHTPEMFQVFARTKGYKPTLWAVVDERYQPLALLLPVQITLKDGLLRPLTTRAIVCGSVLCSTDKPTQALATLLTSYAQRAKRQAIFTELRNLTDLSTFQQILNQSRFCYEDHYNYLIDLNKPEQDIWQSISQSGRKAIRKSINRGIIVDVIHDRSAIPIFYNLLHQTYRRARVPLPDISLFEAVFDVLVPKGMAKMLLGRVENSYVAASLEMPYKDIIYSWYSGYDWNSRSVYPNDGLVWYILKWGAENGYRSFDFGGAGKLDEFYGVRDFKAKFGGRLVNFGRNTYVHSPFSLALSKVGYRFYRQIIR